MIVNVTRKKFLEMVQKIELINWFEINYAVQNKPPRPPPPPPPKNIQLWQYLAMKLSFHIWVSTSLFQTYFGRSFSGISPPKVLGVGTFSKEKGFSWGTNFWRQIYWGIVLPGGDSGGLMIRSCQGETSFTKCILQ